MINRGKTEQIILENEDSERFEIFRQEDRLHCFVLANTLSDDTEVAGTNTVGVLNSHYSKKNSINGKFSFNVYFEREEARDELIDFLYRNLGIIKVIRRKLYYGDQREAYAYCTINKDTVERVGQTTMHEGTLTFDRHTEWLVEEVLEFNKSNYVAQYYETLDVQMDFRFSDLEISASSNFVAGTSVGHLAPYFLIGIKGTAVNPKISLSQGDYTEVIQFENTELGMDDLLMIDNRWGLPLKFGLKHTLNGSNYFGHTKTRVNPIYVPSGSGIVQNPNDYGINYVSFFYPRELGYNLLIENCNDFWVKLVHRYVRF